MALPRSLALAAGSVLFALPFFQSGLGSAGHGGPSHMDHEPHHGGSLLMLGSHHIEVVQKEGSVELYRSDASRRPERETFATVAFDDGAPLALEWGAIASPPRGPRPGAKPSTASVWPASRRSRSGSRRVECRCRARQAAERRDAARSSIAVPAR
jgi:hypothetical protein